MHKPQRRGIANEITMLLDLTRFNFPEPIQPLARVSQAGCRQIESRKLNVMTQSRESASGRWLSEE
jgi:hypothetical protein